MRQISTACIMHVAESPTCGYMVWTKPYEDLKDRSGRVTRYPDNAEIRGHRDGPGS
jgi:hypothetical protein